MEKTAAQERCRLSHHVNRPTSWHVQSPLVSSGLRIAKLPSQKLGPSPFRSGASYLGSAPPSQAEMGFSVVFFPFSLSLSTPLAEARRCCEMRDAACSVTPCCVVFAAATCLSLVVRGRLDRLRSKTLQEILST